MLPQANKQETKSSVFPYIHSYIEAVLRCWQNLSPRPSQGCVVFCFFFLNPLHAFVHSLQDLVGFQDDNLETDCHSSKKSLKSPELKTSQTQALELFEFLFQLFSFEF